MEEKGVVHCSIYTYTCTFVWLNRNPELLDLKPRTKTGGAALQSHSTASGQRVKYGFILDILLSFPGKYKVSILADLISSQFELHSTNSDCLHT